MKRHRRIWGTLALLCAAPAAASAQAFGLNEIGSCAVARAFATTAQPCKDASTIYWNPAAATSINGWNVAAGAAAIAIKGRFTQDTTGRAWDADEPTSIVPHVFVNYHAPNSKAAWGVGFYVPYGLTSQWTDDFPGRFSVKKATLATYYIQPNVAWQITPQWSIGGGPVFGHSNVELIQALDLSTAPTPFGIPFSSLGIAPGTEFGRVQIKGSGTAWGAQVGIAGHLGRDWNVGARFLTPLEFKYDDADATFTQSPTNLVVGGTLAPTVPAGTPVDSLVGSQFASGGRLVAQKASTNITHPAQVQAGIAYTGFTNWLLEADYAFVGWKRFKTLPVDFTDTGLSKSLIENYHNSSAIRVGAEYTLPSKGVQFRGGLSGVQSAAPDETVTPLLPEQDRMYGTLGVGVPFGKIWMLDAAYAHIATSGARGRITERTTAMNSTPTAGQLNSGVFDLSANVFSLTLKASF